MDTSIAKARVLMEALPYIQEFRDAIIVVKFGGSAMEDRSHLEGVLQDITFMECIGMHPVLVHGGGKAISRGLEKEGIKPRFLNGLRVTCEKTIGVVERVIKDEVNADLVSTLERMGARATSLHGDAIFRVERLQKTEAATGEVLDWGFVGEPGAVATDPILELVQRDIIPVITPLGLGPDDRLHNINADTAAAAVARALTARKLAFLSDVPGLLGNPDDPDSLIATLRTDEVDGLIERGTISGGMLPKVRSCVDALLAGVGKVHMIDGRVPHSLLLEIFTAQGVGTEIVKP